MERALLRKIPLEVGLTQFFLNLDKATRIAGEKLEVAIISQVDKRGIDMQIDLENARKIHEHRMKHPQTKNGGMKDEEMSKMLKVVNGQPGGRYWKTYRTRRSLSP